jgi:hypothetical protein
MRGWMANRFILKRLAEREGFDSAPHIAATQVTDFANRLIRQNRLKRRTKVHAGYTEP